MTARSPRTLRRSASLVVTFAMALSLPGVGEAHHNDCDAQGSSDPHAAPPPGAVWCPEFSPGFLSTVSYPFRNTPASIHLEMSQADHESTALRWESYLPAEWQFDTTIRTAEHHTSTPTVPAPATSCTDIFNPAGVAMNAEAIGDGPGMIGRVNDGSNGARQTRFWGRARYDSSSSSRRNHTGQFVFWKSDGTTTDLCLFLQTHTTSSTPAYPVVIPIELLRLPSPMGPYGWKVTVDLEGVAGQFASGLDFSMTSLTLNLARRSSGTWNLANGVRTPVTFSRAPRNPVQTAIGMRAFACTNGADTMAACLAPGNDGTIIQFPTAGDTQYDEPLVEFPFVVNLPPATAPQPWAALTGAGETNLPGAGTSLDHPAKGFGYSDGIAANDNRLRVAWNPLTAGLASGVEVVGYALGIRKVTAHQSPSTDEEIAAGRVAYRREISNGNPFVISFDLEALPENASLGSSEGKYDVALVTIYNTPFGNGYRSDGLCDGVLSGADPADNGRGVLCPTGRPIWLANGTSRDGGISRWSVIARDHGWPLRYFTSSNGQPFQLLLLDASNSIGELTFWGATKIGSSLPMTNYEAQGIADQGPAKVFRGPAAVISDPIGPLPGVISFGALTDLEGESLNWSWNGLFEFDGGATGQLVQYNARGGDLDWLASGLTVDPNDPTASLDPSHDGDCALSITTGCPSGTPVIITTDFDGGSF